nr:MAG TPA: hypothetical protein [Bacteriophage sp.]
MVILTKKTKYDSILEGVRERLNESVMGDLRKVGNSKVFTPLKGVLGGKFNEVEVGFRIHKIKADTFTLDVEYFVDKHDLDARINVVVRCECSYTSDDATNGMVTITAKQIIVQELDAPVTTLNTFKPFKIKCDIDCVKDYTFVSTGFDKVATDVSTVLFDNLLKAKDLDKGIAKKTGNAVGFSSFKDFMTLASR